jgi:predicted FMN-binding regulatory protein PaiB
MTQLKTALVCLVVLYGVDAYFCSGWYFSATEQIIVHASKVDW